MKLSQNFSILFWIYRSKVTSKDLSLSMCGLPLTVTEQSGSTKRVIEPDAWDSDKGKVIDAHPEASIINDYIKLMYGEINRHYNMLLATQTHVMPNMVKDSYLGKGKAKQEKRTFAKHFYQYIIKQLEEKVKVGDLSTGTIERESLPSYRRTLAIRKHDHQYLFLARWGALSSSKLPAS